MPSIGEIAKRVRCRIDRATVATGRADRTRTGPREFGLEWMRYYLPHYLTEAPSRFHTDLMTDLGQYHRTRGQRRVYRGPRGSGKTSYLSKGYPLYCAVEGIEPLTLLLAETGEQAAAYLRAIKHELETNRRLAADYPAAFGPGAMWRDDRAVLRNGSTIVSRGAGGRVLGLTQGASRPTLVVGDDLNQRGDAYSPTLRGRKWDWFTKDVLNVGGPSTNFLVAGTSIHREAIVCHLSRSAAWRTRRYASILRFPERMDLWDQWEQIISNLGDADRDTKARQFYEAYRADMDAGAEVVWPDREPLYDLMRRRAADGLSAFNSEKQDQEGTDGATEWPTDYFDWPGLWFDQWPDPGQLVFKVQTLDPSKGVASKAGDYQAHVMLGLTADGVLWIEAELQREPPTDMISRSLDLASRFQPNVLRAEGNSTMGLLTPEFERQLQERAAKQKPVALTYEEVIQSVPKLARIRRAGPYLARRQIRVRNTAGGRMLVDQWRDVPNGEFDDGPDSAGTAIITAEEWARGGRS